MLPTAALIAVFVGLCLSQHVALVPLNVNSWQRLPFPVQVGTRFVIRGIYRSSSYKNAAKISLFDGGNNLPLTMHLKFNQDNDAGTRVGRYKIIDINYIYKMANFNYILGIDIILKFYRYNFIFSFFKNF